MLINRSSPIAKLATPFNETKSDKATVRLSEHTLKMLKEQAKYEGYLNQSHWVRAAILSKLRNKPVLSIPVIIQDATFSNKDLKFSVMRSSYSHD
ncbi:hypothetical protein D5018_21225 [Parashewanella curva]|uniref:Ribbon-helix-helix protein, CopG family n=2 Tax=Parashewanella curva TaxID=2338552 RepID=A0A3L8PQN1_9GAMM|nr:hypothetical protein D5018_21225 [Parashewanella curva]